MNEEEKLITIFKIFCITIISFLIALCFLFFVGVSKVDALNAIGGYNTSSDTQGVWWKEGNLDYSCGTSISNVCGNFDRALAIFYNYQPSTNDNLTFSTSIYTQATYMNTKTWNSTVYILWGYSNNLYYNWSLQDSCTIDTTFVLEHLDSITDKKYYNFSISCSAKPPISGAYPVIYVLQRFSNDTWGGLSNYVFDVGYVSGTMSSSADNTDIIIANNQNTQQIIENNNNNTTTIIENNNENTEEITNAINDVKSSITSSSVSNPTNTLNGYANRINTNSVISDLILLPVNIYQNVLNSINGTCSAYTLGSLYGHNLTLPCLHIDSILGNTIYGAIDVILSGMLFLAIRKKFVDIFNHFTSFRTGGNELE